MPFELFEDFDISHLINGDESWYELLGYRNGLNRPSLSFYLDKVACKRWFPTLGFEIPEVYALYYADELSSEFGATSHAARVAAIARVLPSQRDVEYAAKPTHKSLLRGNWLVRYRHGNDRTSFSTTACQLSGSDTFRPVDVAISLAEELRTPPDEIESWALKNVRPGFVIEERWKAHDDDEAPPHEFNIFTIWGRVWVAQWNYVDGQNRWSLGFIRRDGTLAPGSSLGEGEIPSWVDWPRLVSMAERVGANKDMFRFDAFVGLPWTVPPLGQTTATEREGLVRIAASEHEIFPTTIFPDDVLPSEAARLWLAGYQAGDYQVVPNSEVPAEFLETGKFSGLAPQSRVRA